MASSLPTKSQRIVSLAPSVTSILVELGARDQLVAVSRWCRDVARVNGLPELGDCWEMDVSPILNLRPTLVVGSVPFKNETVQRILALPVPFLALHPRSLADVESDVRLLAQVAGRIAAGERLIRKMRGQFRRVERTAKKAKSRWRVYCEAWPNPRISSPPWVAEMVEIAGGTMLPAAGKKVTDQEVAQARPDIILLAWTATGGRSKPEQAFSNPAWQDVPAIRNGKVFAIRDELLNTPGPPLACGAEELLRRIHPELLRDGSNPGRRKGS